MEPMRNARAEGIVEIETRPHATEIYAVRAHASWNARQLEVAEWDAIKWDAYCPILRPTQMGCAQVGYPRVRVRCPLSACE